MSANHLTALALLSVILMAAVHGDVRNHRIPNALIVFGLCAALALQGLTGGLHGFLLGFKGAIVGLLCFAPFFLLRGMGGGDVKLLATVGAFLGPQGALIAALLSLVVGGFVAISYVVWRAIRALGGTSMLSGRSASYAATLGAIQDARHQRLAFAIPIALGSLAAGLQLSGYQAPASWSLRWLS
jgi:prepilin peptidase CpaA